MNRLKDATSPYLLQHAGNPVDWWEWGEDALAEARRRDVPVLLSVGYAACHWCHVMAHESFEDGATAALMNELFVNIKVDREERPDIDAVYMEATQAMTGQGGWPMTVFMTPDGAPFYCGTYFPREHFHAVLRAVHKAWTEQRDGVEQQGRHVVEALTPQESGLAGTLAPDAETLENAVRSLAESYDAARGGFGGAPKFPPSMVLEFLLRHHARTRDDQALAMAGHTLEAMARGGMYDQLGGGFARYSVDASWVVPHFEKMLYDNALLARVYAHWWRITGSPFARRIALETCDWMVHDLRTAEGGFASALDADSEGEEGRYYVWTPAQLEEVLGPDDAAYAVELFEVTGTFEHGTSVLQLPDDPDDRARFERIRSALLAARELRVPPARDDKVVASWNGLAVAALAECGALFERPDLVRAAEGAVRLLAEVHLRDGRLARTSRDGVAGANAGVLDDYGNVAEGLLALHGVTGDPTQLRLAGELLETVLEHFSDGQEGFYDTADDAERLFRRPKDPTDNASPSGRFAAAGALLSYAALTAVPWARQAAGGALAPAKILAERGAARFAGWGLAVAEANLAGPLEIGILGEPDDPRTHELHRTALMATSPGAVVSVGEPGVQDVPLLDGRPLVDGVPTAYVCKGFVCRLPVTTGAALGRELRQ
ncbi:thioredoxin domain-containing protein [Actinomadura logoneensis]|uniref:Thioredoxin domain-containing protein n=1 Tax=Actinomadura logoneensis TaxID=2293572 RepID=A0A372JRN2_9ACTN|nr:thioredoxin domain-containing protein [Actinomadura logoneensis]RFU42672.1 thioredoxin domain-containing protein [Actinomadura logoneensis]